MAFTAHLAALSARYDARLMRAPEAPPVAVASADWRPLQDWCLAGAGPGGTPFWQPGALPRVGQRFALAQWTGEAAVVQAWALALDGSTRLAAQRGAAGRLALRLRTKLDDGCWWRRRAAGDPWDAGHLLDSDAALARLQQGFQPRRATLLIAGAMDPARLAAAIQALQRHAGGLHHPVRLLCLADAPVPAAAPLSRLDAPR